jgi:ACR3 family arsenite transporter
MGVGIAIGNTVDSAGPALQKGEFVGVSIPIGMSSHDSMDFGGC